MAPDLTFGPPGRGTLYTWASRTFDLTRAGDAGANTWKFRLSTTHGAADTSVDIDPAHTALIVVDMQNIFLDPKCYDNPTGVAAIEPLIGVITRCRALGIEVIWLNWGLTEEDLANMPASVLRGFAASRIAQTANPLGAGLGEDLGEGMGRLLTAGSWNAEIIPRLVAVAEPVDVHCAKNRISGMWTSTQPLWQHLEKSGKTTLLFSGVNTDECVQGTLFDAYNAGWDCILLDDCCGTTTPNGHSTTLYNVAVYYGFVSDSKAFAAGVLEA
ncbi:isochorismatase [Xylariaceae sp. FL1272]|nr:isochorismatase [Xylariaceae sp. FL1272]